MAATRFGPADWKFGYKVADGSYSGWYQASVLSTSAGVEAGTAGSPLYVTVAAGGGGAVTIADGADVAEGATSATVYSDVTGAAAGTVVALGKGNYVLTAALSAKLPASLGIKTAAGSLSVALASDGTLPLPTGAATETTLAAASAKLPATLGQKTGANSLSVVWASDATLPTGTNTIGTVLAQGTLANLSTSSPNPFLQAARFMTTRPTYTNGQLGEVQMDNRGGVYASLSSGANVVTITTLSGDGFSTGNVGLVTRSETMVSNGTTLDITRKPNVVKRIASSAASGNPDFLKASAGELSQFWGTCGVTAAFLQVYNKASAPTVGSDTPILTYPIPAAANFTQTIPNGGLYFSTGVAFAFTTDAAGTTGSAAAAITACMLIGM